MELHVAFENGMLADAYAKYGNPKDIVDGLNLRSFPFEVTDLPQHTKALAWIFLDWDSVPVCGFPWIHWCAWTQISPTAVSEGLGLALEDDSSRLCDEIYQGYNSAAHSDRALATGYVGPCPPDKDHTYTLYAAALSNTPKLNQTFWANELIAEIKTCALEFAKLDIPSRS